MNIGKMIRGAIALSCWVGVLAGVAESVSAQTVRDVYRKAKDSVVVVRTIQREVASTNQGKTLVSAPGLGSGVLISADGKVLTAAHVVQTADQIAVQFDENTIVPAKVIASQRVSDVALIQLLYVPKGVTPATLGDSDKAEIGEEVVVIGAPFGLEKSLSVGYISGRKQSNVRMGSFQAVDFLQTDAAINTGNSGGPMFNMKGEVIGIVSNILTRSGGFEGIGFAATSNIAKQVLLEQKSFYSGVEGILLEGKLAQVFNVSQEAGFLIQHVAEGSPLWRMGIRGGEVSAVIDGNELLLGGDVILSINGVKVAPGNRNYDDIFRKLSSLKPGDTLTCKILRAGEVQELSTIIADQ